MELTWEEKAAALDALREISIKIRKPGDWYVDQDAHVREEHVTRSCYGNGPTPQAAIEDHWRNVTEVTPPHYVVTGEPRRAVRWNGFMWQDVREPKHEAAA